VWNPFPAFEYPHSGMDFFFLKLSGIERKEIEKEEEICHSIQEKYNRAEEKNNYHGCRGT
jgi:hypothetical protein